MVLVLWWSAGVVFRGTERDAEKGGRGERWSGNEKVLILAVLVSQFLFSKGCSSTQSITVPRD